MKAFLLAAGIGSRLRPITLTTPKCLVPIGDRLLIDIWYNILENLNITEVLLNTSHFSHQIQHHINNLPTSIKTTITYEKELLERDGTII